MIPSLSQMLILWAITNLAQRKKWIKISPAKIIPFPKDLSDGEQFYQLLNAFAPLVFL
jgi:hypothetical protein